MANLKNITELPVTESADGLNLIVNDNGVAKQIAASKVGAQADWNVEDENSPAFVKNKPVIAQTDWNQNDPSAPNYVKNRPFYEETTEALILERYQTRNFSGQPEYPAGEDINASIVVGRTYIVVWDGVEYECRAELFNEMPFIGDYSLCDVGGEGWNTEEGFPFMFMQQAPSTYTMMLSKQAGVHDVTIYERNTVVHRLDTKYLPFQDILISEAGELSTPEGPITFAEVEAKFHEGAPLRFWSNDAIYSPCGLDFGSIVLVRVSLYGTAVGFIDSIKIGDGVFETNSVQFNVSALE